jgi:transketolase
MTTTAQMKTLATQVRRDIVRMVHAVQSGHPGGSLGCADFMTALYTSVLNHDPNNFTISGYGQDIFFLSNGHLSAVWYSLLARTGYFPVSELASFRRLNTRLQGHPTPAEGLPGVRVASGSLGQGLSVAIGAALAKRLDKDPNLVYTLHGDGELQEGQIWEAAMFAAGRKVDNIIATIDYNGKQIDGPVDVVMPLGDLKAKWEAFGWIVLEMDGHNFDKILATLAKAKELTGQGNPIVILMHTHMGQGVDFMVDKHQWHGSPPSDQDLESALAQLEETLGDY